MNKLLEEKGPEALVQNEIDNLADMEGETDLETLQQRCGLVKRAIWDLLDYLKKENIGKCQCPKYHGVITEHVHKCLKCKKENTNNHFTMDV